MKTYGVWWFHWRVLRSVQITIFPTVVRITACFYRQLNKFSGFQVLWLHPASNQRLCCISGYCDIVAEVGIFMSLHLLLIYCRLASPGLAQPWAPCQIRKFWVAHAPGMPETYCSPQQVVDPDMHHGTCVTHVPCCMPGSPASSFVWSRWRGKRSRHSQRMRNP